METLLVMGGMPLALRTDSLSVEVCLVEVEDLIPDADLTAIADGLIVLLRRLGVLLLWVESDNQMYNEKTSSFDTNIM